MSRYRGRKTRMRSWRMGITKVKRRSRRKRWKRGRGVKKRTHKTFCTYNIIAYSATVY